MRTKKPKAPLLRTPRARVKSYLRLLFLRSVEHSIVMKRDGYRCVMCGVKKSMAKGREVKVQCHHLNGIDWDAIVDIILERVLVDPELMETRCVPCHSTKEL